MLTIPIFTFVTCLFTARLYFPLPAPDTKLAVIRKQVADYTQLPEHSFKLIHAGAVMKDDNAPSKYPLLAVPSRTFLLVCDSYFIHHSLVSAYGIKENSTLAVIGGGDNSVPDPKKSSKKTVPQQPRTQESTISQIRSEVDKVRQNLQPDVDTFLASLQSTPTQSAESPQPVQSTDTAKPKSELEQQHARLGELLLQSLLRLDAINADGEWEEARKERKGAVKEVQGLLDRLDGGWKNRVQS